MRIVFIIADKRLALIFKFMFHENVVTDKSYKKLGMKIEKKYKFKNRENFNQ